MRNGGSGVNPNKPRPIWIGGAGPQAARDQCQENPLLEFNLKRKMASIAQTQVRSMRYANRQEF